jgi:hypothetical protein
MNCKLELLNGLARRFGGDKSALNVLPWVFYSKASIAKILMLVLQTILHRTP